MAVASESCLLPAGYGHPNDPEGLAGYAGATPERSILDFSAFKAEKDKRRRRRRLGYVPPQVLPEVVLPTEPPIDPDTPAD